MTSAPGPGPQGTSGKRQAPSSKLDRTCNMWDNMIFKERKNYAYRTSEGRLHVARRSAAGADQKDAGTHRRAREVGEALLPLREALDGVLL